jgi:hypothetical protein
MAAQRLVLLLREHRRVAVEVDDRAEPEAAIAVELLEPPPGVGELAIRPEDHADLDHHAVGIELLDQADLFVWAELPIKCRDPHARELLAGELEVLGVLGIEDHLVHLVLLGDRVTGLFHELVAPPARKRRVVLQLHHLRHVRRQPAEQVRKGLDLVARLLRAAVVELVGAARPEGLAHVELAQFLEVGVDDRVVRAGNALGGRVV